MQPCAEFSQSSSEPLRGAGAQADRIHDDADIFADDARQVHSPRLSMTWRPRLARDLGLSDEPEREDEQQVDAEADAVAASEATSRSDRATAFRAAVQVWAGAHAEASAAARFKTVSAARAYILHRRLVPWRHAALVLYLALGFLELPPFCADPTTQGLCHGNRLSDELWAIPSTMLPNAASFSLALSLLLFLLADASVTLVASSGSCSNRRVYSGVMHLPLIVASVVEVLLRLVSPRVLGTQVVVYRLLRPFIFACASARARQAMRLVSRAVWETRHLYMFTAGLILLFGWIGVVLFADCDPRFSTFGGGLHQMFVLLTTANYPDIQSQSLKHSPFAFLFFFVFLCVGYFLFMNLILSDLYSAYHRVLQAFYLCGLRRQEVAISEAFALLSSTGRLGTVSRPVWCDFYTTWAQLALCDNRARDRGAAIYDRVQIVNQAPWGLDEDEFTALVLTLCSGNVARTIRQTTSRPPDSDSQGQCRRCVDAFLSSSVTKAVMDILLCVNLVVLLVQTCGMLASIRDSGGHFSDGRNWNRSVMSDIINSLFTLLWALEVTARVWAKGGPTRYWRTSSLWMRLDVLCVALATVGEIWARLAFGHESIPLPQNFYKYLLILKMARALRVVGRQKTTQTFFICLLRILPGMKLVLNMVLVVFLVFAELGVQLFGGVLRPSNPALKDTLYPSLDYWQNNFNSLGSASISMFELLCVNNWIVIMDTLAQVLGDWVLLFFMTHYVVGVTILLNVFIAFIIEAWHAEMRVLGSCPAEPPPARSRVPSGQGGAAATPAPAAGALDREAQPGNGEVDAQGGPCCPPSPLPAAVLRSPPSPGSLAPEEYIPDRAQLLRDMFASAIRTLALASPTSCARLSRARETPRGYIRQIPGLESVLSS